MCKAGKQRETKEDAKKSKDNVEKCRQNEENYEE